VHQQEKIADLEETLKAKKAYADELEAKSIEREDLLGKIEADKEQKAKELSEKDKELNESAAKLAQALEENEKLKKQIEELDLSAANVLTSGFGAAFEQFACTYPDLDLSQFSICHEVVDGNISNESLLAISTLAPISFANKIPAIKASYSAWLLLALKANIRDCSINMSLGPSRIIPVPLPNWLEDPSTESTQRKPSLAFCTVSEDSSTTKSAKICPLIGPRGSYLMSNSDNSTAHFTILPATSGFFRTFWIGKSVITNTVKLWK